ncbi:MAG TPA: M43 family zinc metalloprotease [Saprospiraceae bacterium]|nr:M43 family zinc metalloprotease [Saprospiraceae bacterium]
MMCKGRLLLLFLLLTLLGIGSCTPKMERYFVQAEDVVFFSARESKAKSIRINGQEIRMNLLQNGACHQYENYIPDQQYPNHSPVYQLRVNFHFIDHGEGGYNYEPAAARKMVASLLNSANHDLKKNNANWLPYQNDYPVLPVGYEMVLQSQAEDPSDDGIYFHQTGEEAFYVHKGRNQNIHHREVIRDFAIGSDSIMNIFIMPHHPDSVLSPTYHVGMVGVYLGRAIKMAGMYELNEPGWAYRGVLNHEMGHALGLRHAWMADGCTDTPTHNNPCWSRSKEPPCDTAASNNVMDYNALQNAYTPCQVGRIRLQLAKAGQSTRGYLVPHWNQLDTNRTILIRDSIVWAGAKDLRGNLIIAPGAKLKVNCRLGMPLGSHILIKAGGTLILEDAQLHHPEGRKWQGIQIEKTRKKKGYLRIGGNTQVLDAVHPLPTAAVNPGQTD